MFLFLKQPEGLKYYQRTSKYCSDSQIITLMVNVQLSVLGVTYYTFYYVISLYHKVTLCMKIDITLME